MHIEPKARKYYQLSIVTEPATAATWEASFDDGETWHPGEESSADVWRWLIAGPEFDPTGEVEASYVALGVADYVPVLLKLSVNPEVVIIDGPTIYFKY